MSKVLEIKNLSKTFSMSGETISVLDKLNLSIESGKKVAIIGQSGSGKTTLLQIAGLLDDPTDGQVVLQKQETATLKDKHKSALRNEHLGFVYQFHHLLPEFTALENVMMPALIGGKITDDQEKRAENLLDKMGLSERKNHLPSQMSGGEQQRTAIARALMNQPKLLLADEPTGNLDQHTAADVFDLLNGLVREESMAMLMVTHNHGLAAQCDEIWQLEDGKLKRA